MNESTPDDADWIETTANGIEENGRNYGPAKNAAAAAAGGGVGQL